MKCKKLKRLGFKVTKTSKERKTYLPRSFFGECLFNLQRLKAHYHQLRTSYLRRFVKKLKFQKKPELHTELVAKLELRLDTLLKRSGLVKTIAEGAQKISHKKVLVNGKKVNVRSYQVTPNSIVELLFKVDSELEKNQLPYITFLGENKFQVLRKPLLKEVLFEVPIDFAKAVNALR